MNCRDIEPLLLAERDGVLPTEQHASLERHIATCPACQQSRARLNDAMAAFRADTAAVAMPDVEAEWQKLRARLHDSSASSTNKKRPLAPVIWFGSSLAAAAAMALAYVGLQPGATLTTAPAVETARADFVETGDASASTMVYVDKDSGWLVVWAVDADSSTKG